VTKLRMCTLLLCLALAACAKEKAPEFCRNHALFHEQHLEELATLRITIGDDGHIRSELSVPDSVLAGVPSTLLAEVGNVYSLQTEKACATPTVNLSAADNSVLAVFESECGAENKIGQVDVLLFETLPALNEVDVTVVTDVTRKHFAINRQCASAIFRL
jgi:hypothetical protein